ncbi:MAG TPA: phosphate ABC transporter permease PstA [Bacteroidaceae bacterium]|mgnify:FL=1|jgi:phosphate transport system permease protein|nr:phosphate ABC transporter permease PstA [Bacteroidaceae bacterium]OPZ47566.1 MAG: Phosphate transport system permease protein PstA [Bacteroidetes bacterium ADurb.BinA104]MBP8602625.1 phosphate ABC transporter permease PstA [Bacteroidaceae bacterium]HOD68711.1 phosphate ABC transporter permease PstA [Bacteroidaceae bacterium]HPX98249.1 phosphate ABC transporter permease PstA [Bacteroidaceae bacterium]
MSNQKTKRRLAKDRWLLRIVCIFATLTAVPLFAILGEVLLRGYKQLSWSFFTQPTPTAYKAMKAMEAGEPIPGGIANGIIGTMIILSMAVVVAVPLGILCGTYLAENSKKRFAQVVSYLTDLVQGIPSVIIGIITYIWVVVPMKSYSAIAGSVALCIMMLPLIIRSTEETLKILPASLKEAGLALGGNKARVMLKVQLPAAFGGIFTGVLLAISRVIGETAPLMFTALGCSFIRWSITKPISAVPLLIWEFFNDPNLQELIWGASLFLLIFVLTLNLLAKYLAKKWNQ